MILKDHCNKTLNYVRDLNIYEDFEIKRIKESILLDDDLMSKLETKNINNKSTYDILNAEIINIEKMNLDCDIDIGDNQCTEDCPYKKFYLQTVGKRNNLNKFIEERNKINKEIIKYEELFNLYNNLIFIKNHLMSYIEDNIPIEYDYSTCFENYINGKPFININLLNLAIDDSEKFELMNQYKKDLESFESEYEMIKSSGLDVIDIENKILNINDIINSKNKIIDSNTDLKLQIEKEIELLTTKSEQIIQALIIKDSMESKLDKHEELRLRRIEISELKKEKELLINSINDNKHKLKQVTEFLNNLISKKNQIIFNMETYDNLVNEYTALKLLFEDAEEIKEALNSSKGIPLIFLQVYLKNCPIMMNSLLDTIYDGELQIEGFLIDENEFRIPFVKSGVRIPDIVMASQGESSFISIVLSLSLIILSMTMYVIICFDVFDGPLDTRNREEFIRVLYSFIEQVNSEQIFIISHNNVFDNESIDLLLTGDIDIDNYKNANIIFKP